YNLSCDRLEEKLILAKKSGRLPKVVIPVHFCGQPCDMRAIHELSKVYGFHIIEDGSHAIGAEYESQKVGVGKFSDITIFSFHPVKIITSGEGGMAVTNNKDIASKIRVLRSHGITSTPEEMFERPEEEIWNYQQINLGFNYRMSDIHAALGLKQIQRIGDFLNRRRAIALRYDQELQGLPITLPFQIKSGLSSYHLYPIRLHLDEIKKTQKEVWNSLRSAGILVNLLYIPVYLQPYYASLGFERGYCPEAEKYFRETISIPMYPDLTDNQQSIVISTIRNVL
ncbi:MAG: DegT/DnrJ/EryC1/StrS family aminotransferase, partial [Emcibacteraceae bacterium]|nr:DegT/DnrJ/EryC1/StrS family aminotransferase [Emcibacteraceae bacterium]